MPTPVQLTPGRVVGGDFRIANPLSAGGMGALYVAEQLSTGKKRALKVMHRQLVREPKLRERFVQEARVGALIESDHVVEVIAAGIDDETGLPWIAMELLDGIDLGDFVADGGQLCLEELVALLRQLCHALGAAHEAGVVHRDVKPENVFLAKTRSAAVPWTVKVLDFGIAKVAAQAKLTATAALGSPAWMAPEQAESQPRITPAADVWALGLLTFWLLARRSYWRAAQDPESTVHALLREVLFDPLAPASQRAEQADELLPAGFDDWFAHCVVRDPAKRYPNAAEAFAAFEQLLLEAGYDVTVAAASTRPSFDRISVLPMDSVFGAADEAEPATQTPSEAPPAPRQQATLIGLQDRPATVPTASEPPPSAHPGDTVVAAPAAESLAPYQPSPTTPMAPAHLSATASTMVTPPEPAPDSEPTLPLRGRWGQVIGIGLVAATIAIALFYAFRNAPKERTPPVIATPPTEEQLAEPPAPSATASEEAPRPPQPTRRAPKPQPASSATAAEPAPPSAAGSEPSAGPFAEPPPSATATAAPEAPPTASAAQPGAFNRVEAIVAVQHQADVAAVQCRDLPGPRLVAATVLFAPTGKVERVALANHVQHVHHTTGCVHDVLAQTEIKPYRGDSEQVSVIVNLR